jgi:glyoxylase-like metal-dependent hydrolase (beta-lactamase superfamily II)/ferredoxin
MANPALRLETNVGGDFFVDSSCIDCDACRIIAPSVFADRGDQSAVVHQPETQGELLAAQRALLSCPTASIGDQRKRGMAAAMASFPSPVAENVLFCGFTSESSFGALSYLVLRPEGNILIDSPRFTAPLVGNLEKMGGVSLMLLTHRDDVADHQKFADHFGCRRVLHHDDVSRSTSSIEEQPKGQDVIRLAEDILMIPVPGHTRGHAVYLIDDGFLFTGDHLAWNERRQTLYAFRSACWYSWEEQTRSMERLLPFRFRWVLPGHGRSISLPEEEMQRELARCVGWMKSFSP